MSRLHTYLIPPTYESTILGVQHVRVGARSVWLKRNNGGQITVPRSALPAELPESFVDLVGLIESARPTAKVARV